jgi:hypothetical protein
MLNMLKKRMIRLIAYMIIITLLGVMFNSCGMITSLFNKDDAESETESDTTTAETEPYIPETTTIEPFVDEPVEITQAPEPEPPVGGQSFSASGTIKSESNQLLKLNIEWLAYQEAGSEYAELELNIFLDCYAISVGGRSNCTVTVDGETTEFKTDRITNENNSLTSLKLHTEKRQVHNPSGDEIKSVDVGTSYYFGGSYGGEAIGWIETNGTIHFVDDGTPIPDPSETEPEETESEETEPEETELVNEEALTDDVPTEETTPTTEEISTEEIEPDPLAPELPEDPFENVE